MTINETIASDFATNGGIFSAIQKKSVFNWLNSTDALTLDYEYYYGHAGNKRLSVLYENLIGNDNAINILANVIILKFRDKWNKLYQAVVDSNYNPLNNYDMVEKENQASKITQSNTQNDYSYGFNSEEHTAVGDTNRSQIIEGSANDNERVLSRSGNIGVASSQQLLESEIKLRDNFQFYTMLLNDVDTVLTLAIY